MIEGLHRFSLTLIVLGCVACASLASAPATPASMPMGAIRIMPPAEYAAWWYEVENCTGLRGNFRSVSFYAVPVFDPKEPYFPCMATTGRCLGLYRPDLNAVFLGMKWIADESVVRHEMIHALGVHGHPPVMFWVCAYDARPS